MDTLPTYASTFLPALMDGLELGALRVNRCKSRDSIFGRAMTVNASCRWGHCGVSRIEHSVVAISTVELQLPSVNRVAKGHRLFRLITHVEGLRIRDKTAHRTRENRTCRTGDEQESYEGVGPAWKQKALHHDQEALGYEAYSYKLIASGFRSLRCDI